MGHVRKHNPTDPIPSTGSSKGLVEGWTETVNLYVDPGSAREYKTSDMTRIASGSVPFGVSLAARWLLSLTSFIWIYGLLGTVGADTAWERDRSFDVRLETAGQVVAMAAYTNGSILIGGSFHRVGDAPRSGCALLDRDGSLVREFVPDLGESAQVLSVAVQPDQKILVTGWFTLVPPRDRLNVVRLNPDGSLDESFKLPFNWIYSLPTVAVMGNGQPLFCGALNVGELHLFRLGADGTPDPDFNSSASISSLESGPVTLTSDPEGKIYAAGAFRDFRNTGQNYLVRLRGDGSMDPSFATGAGFDSAVFALAVGDDRKIFAGGVFQSFNNAVRPGVARLDSDGTLDLEFKPRDIVMASVRSLVATPDGGVLVGGLCRITGEATPWGVVRLTRTGEVDRSFLRLPVRDGSGREVTAIVPAPGGRTWAGGFRLEETNRFPSPVLRIGPAEDGNEVRGPEVARRGVANAMIPVQGGGLVVGGDFERVNTEFRPGLARILFQGVPDGDFVPQVDRLDSVRSLEVDRDGGVYVGVPAESDRPFQQTVRRFRPDGSVDTAFSTLVVDSAIREMHLAGSGELIVCGFPDPAAPGLGALVGLGPDGSVRSNAFPGSIDLFSTFAVLPMPDGSVFCGGNFAAGPAATGPNYFARLNPDGTLDSTFHVTNEAGEEQFLDSIVTSLAADSKGRIIVGGWFRHVGSIPVPGILRLLPSGRMDRSFQTAFQGDNVDDVWVDSEDRVVARGSFLTSFLPPMRTVVRVLTDGTVDPEFPVVTASVGSIAIQGDAVFVSAGESPFSEDDSGRLIRIAPAPKRPSVTAQFDSTTGSLELRLTPGSDSPLRLEASTDLMTWNPVGPAEAIMHVPVSSEKPAAYFRVGEAR